MNTHAAVSHPGMLLREPAAVPKYIELIRVSGQTQVTRDTPQDQRAALDALRTSRPGQLVARIEEGAVRAVSGAADFSKRLDLQKLFALAKAKAFTEVRIRRLDRLSRHPDPRERFAIFGAIMDAGAIIVDASGHVIDPKTELGEVDYFFQSLMASRERKSILERTSTARLRLAKQGQLQGRPPYGRAWDKRTLTWSVRGPEFAIYKRIFAAYLKGESCLGIAKRLNQERIPPPGAAWNRTSPRWKHAPVWRHTNIHALLTRRSAIGELTSCGQNIACPAVVDVETFGKVQELLRLRNMRAGRPPAVDTRALLRGLAYCPHCGSRMWISRGGSRGHWHLYYVCAMARLVPLDSKCRKRHRVDAVDERAKQFIREYVLDSRACKIGQDEGGRCPEDEIAAAQRELRKLDKAEEHIVRLRIRGLASPRVLENQLLELKRERAAIETKIAKAKLAREREVQRDAAQEDGQDILVAARRLLCATGVQLDFTSWRDLLQKVAGFLQPIRLMPNGSLKVG